MIIKLGLYSLFVPDKYFRQKLDGCRNQPESRKSWRFIHTGESLVFRDDDSKEALAAYLDVEPEAFIVSLRDYLAKYKSVVGIEVNDGLFVHPEALGKFLLNHKV